MAVYNFGGRVYTTPTPNMTLTPRFECFYMCLEVRKEGFLGGYKNFISVDGCYLKTFYGG